MVRDGRNTQSLWGAPRGDSLPLWGLSQGFWGQLCLSYQVERAEDREPPWTELPCVPGQWGSRLVPPSSPDSPHPRSLTDSQIANQQQAGPGWEAGQQEGVRVRRGRIGWELRERSARWGIFQLPVKPAPSSGSGGDVVQNQPQRAVLLTTRCFGRASQSLRAPRHPGGRAGEVQFTLGFIFKQSFQRLSHRCASGPQHGALACSGPAPPASLVGRL